MGLRSTGTHAYGVVTQRGQRQVLDVVEATGYSVTSHPEGDWLTLSNEKGEIVRTYEPGAWVEVLTALPDDLV